MKTAKWVVAVAIVALAFVAAQSARADGVTVAFPTAGDAYSATDIYGNTVTGTLPSGMGQGVYMFTAGDYLLSDVFAATGLASVNGLTANWTYQDFLYGSTETFGVYLNGILIGSALLPDDGGAGDMLTINQTFGFGNIAPVSGGYQIELVVQDTIAPGGGSMAWQDGGSTTLSAPVPEPSSLLLLGAGLVSGLALLALRKLT